MHIVQQKTVLIGETSSRLFSFLPIQGCLVTSLLFALSHVNSLPSRWQKGSKGKFVLFQDTSVIVCSSCSSSQEFGCKVIFMTDPCLLQHYMSAKQLPQISCIIVDEAHERSSSIDFFLAITKNLLGERRDLRLIIMSATADADKLANYKFCSGTFHVAGRNYPIDINMLRSMKGLLVLDRLHCMFLICEDGD
ncbi:ATP-dependent RNA helicase DEAH11, chloroplastic-like [Olea europaea var. sylvestris]|uniref:ATP-dependent RNA helicase DEAH11, chloroplastic-like n=1 Tax=Olea europaea var. sylvestris TaxID=158386 RepID=UPI000C1D7539|nr:ATP-dependent RNA helicase DEAH11, chloroplastic-like [Olea europaea var. sylvestris]